MQRIRSLIYSYRSSTSKDGRRKSKFVMQYQLGVVLFYILDIDVVPFIPPLVHNKYASDAAHSSPVATTGIGSNVPAKPQASNLRNNNIKAFSKGSLALVEHGLTNMKSIRREL